MTYAHPTTPPDQDVRTTLGREHQELHTLFGNVVDAFESGSNVAAAALFTALENALAAHFQLEEEHLLPALARVEPDEAHALRVEHDALRAKLTALAVGVDLHTTRASAIRDFIQTLDAHAAREDALAYPWAGSHLPETALARIRSSVAERLVSLRARIGSTSSTR